jgi:hypothetical protein
MKVRRLPHYDTLDVEDGTVVLHGEHATLLSPVSAALWNSLSDPKWVDLDEVRSQLADEFGPPPSDQAIPDLIAELASAGLVEVGP